MLKVRITFIDNEQGNIELQNLVKLLREENEIIYESNIYKGRGMSKYSSVYIDLETK